jgi:aquaporin Z
MDKYITEFLGTFFLMIAIGLASGPNAAIGIGMTLVVLVYLGAHISGAHYNPAVTLAFALRGKIGIGQAIAYMFTQVLAAFLAAEMLSATLMGAIIPRPALLNAMPAQVIGYEAIWTMLLILVIFNVADHPKTEKNQYFGLAIGGTVMAGAIALGKATGGVFNPAVALGAAFAEPTVRDYSIPTWNYLLAHAIAAVFACLIFSFQRRVK